MVENSRGRRRAAQYVRMSTDRQQQSIATQMKAIRAYADANDIDVVKTYADEGRSGLTLNGRPGLRILIGDIARGQVGFELLLVYDVSRWGRFQDVDESAHYEFLCRQAGVRLIYVAEPFGAEPSELASIAKSLKRIMASEYSRELGEKVSLSARRLAQQGRRQGSGAPLGYQRWVVDEGGRLLGPLGCGERKLRREEYVTLRPGPPDAVQVVRAIFDLVANKGLSAPAVARRLNVSETPSPEGLTWGASTILSIVSNPVYAGHLVYNRRTSRLKSPARRNSPSDWIFCKAVYPAIVTQAQFDAAQRPHGRGARDRTDETLLDDLKNLLLRRGRLSAALIAAEPEMARPSSYRRRFGSLLRAYELVGHDPVDKLPIAALRSHDVRRLQMATAKSIQAELSACGLSVSRTRTHLVVEGLAVEFVLLTPNWRGKPGWKNSSRLRDATFYLVGRVAADRVGMLDFALVGPAGLPREVRVYAAAAAEALAVGGYHALPEVVRDLAEKVRSGLSPRSLGLAPGTGATRPLPAG